MEKFGLNYSYCPSQEGIKKLLLETFHFLGYRDRLTYHGQYFKEYHPYAIMDYVPLADNLINKANLVREIFALEGLIESCLYIDSKYYRSYSTNNNAVYFPLNVMPEERLKDKFYISPYKIHIEYLFDKPNPRENNKLTYYVPKKQLPILISLSYPLEINPATPYYIDLEMMKAKRLLDEIKPIIIYETDFKFEIREKLKRWIEPLRKCVEFIVENNLYDY